MKLLKIPVHFAKKLTEIKLPSDKWEAVGVEITFRRKGTLEEYATVVWDDMNAVFYVKTQKAIVYPDDELALQEALFIMREANGIVRPSVEKT